MSACKSVSLPQGCSRLTQSVNYYQKALDEFGGVLVQLILGGFVVDDKTAFGLVECACYLPIQNHF